MVDAVDQPVAQPHFVVIVVMGFDCLDRAKRRVQYTCGYHEDFPALQYKHDQAEPEEASAHDESRINSKFAGQVFHWGDLVTHAVEHCGFFRKLAQNLVHQRYFNNYKLKMLTNY